MQSLELSRRLSAELGIPEPEPIPRRVAFLDIDHTLTYENLLWPSAQQWVEKGLFQPERLLEMEQHGLDFRNADGEYPDDDSPLGKRREENYVANLVRISALGLEGQPVREVYREAKEA